MRSVLALSAFALLAAAQAALAEAPANTIMKVAPPGPPKTDAMDAQVLCTHKVQMELAQLRALQARLKLTAAQKPVFEAWKKARTDMFLAIPCPPLPVGLEVPAPKRVENQIAATSASLEGLKKELPATQALYNVLTPDQKAVFDGPIRLSVPPPGAAEKPVPPTPVH